MGKRSYRNKPEGVQRKALESVAHLIKEADGIHQRHPGLANRYAAIAKRISLKHKLRLPIELKRRICKGCTSFLIPGTTSRVRTRGGNVVITCFTCKRISRIGYRNSTKIKPATED